MSGNTRITLLTDFGTRDPYVASIKGVIATIAPSAVIIDLAHEITPGNITEGAIFLAAAVPRFPPGTIHVAVIDPGVGTERKALVVSVARQVVICPDNGLLTLLARYHCVEAAYAIENARLMRNPVSATFHGRDVFAPVAAHLAVGAGIESAGPALERWVELPWPEPRRTGNMVEGVVVHIDRFGNAITNIPDTMIPNLHPSAVECGGHRMRLHRTYGDVAYGETLALIGSTKYLEISTHGASAADTLGLTQGAPVRVQP